MAGTLIVALDLDTRGEAERWSTRLGDTVDFYKIGYQLFYGGDGLALGKALLAAGKRVFFDLKLLDIDNTVEKGVAAIARTGATMLTVHAYPQVHAGRRRGGAAGSDLCLLGVTVLTSMDDADLADAGYACDTAGLVALRAEQAQRRRHGRHRLLAARGRDGARDRRPRAGRSSRPASARRAAAMGDQKRVMGPAEALRAGASHLVVGRPITAAPIRRQRRKPSSPRCRAAGRAWHDRALRWAIRRSPRVRRGANMSDLKVAIAGAGGNMGAANIRAISLTPGIAGAFRLRSGRLAAIGKDAGELAGVGTLGVAITRRSAAGLRQAPTACSISPRRPRPSSSPATPRRRASSMSSARPAARPTTTRRSPRRRASARSSSPAI